MNRRQFMAATLAAAAFANLEGTNAFNGTAEAGPPLVEVGEGRTGYSSVLVQT